MIIKVDKYSYKVMRDGLLFSCSNCGGFEIDSVEIANTGQRLYLNEAVALLSTDLDLLHEYLLNDCLMYEDSRYHDREQDRDH